MHTVHSRRVNPARNKHVKPSKRAKTQKRAKLSKHAKTQKHLKTQRRCRRSKNLDKHLTLSLRPLRLTRRERPSPLHLRRGPANKIRSNAASKKANAAACNASRPANVPRRGRKTPKNAKRASTLAKKKLNKSVPRAPLRGTPSTHRNATTKLELSVDVPRREPRRPNAAKPASTIGLPNVPHFKVPSVPPECVPQRRRPSRRRSSRFQRKACRCALSC